MSNIFKQLKKIIIIILKTISLLFVIAYAAWFGFEYYWYRGFIPEKIGVTFPVSISGETGFREGCGAAIFLLNGSTVDAIRRDGASFFEDATHSRKSNDYYHTYQPWIETPAPNSTSDDFLSGLSCSRSIINSIIPTNKWIYEAARKKGSYYSTKHESEILVIPSLKLVVFIYFG
jgi:hypothetical protein